MSLQHNHGAAVSGTKSENKLAQITRSVGLRFLKVKDDFENLGLSQWGRRYHKPPSNWQQKTKTGKQRKFESDGFIPITDQGRGIIIEQKHSDKHGTTEEKVFYDLMKIEKGVYGKENWLWYVFTGEAAEDIEVYKEFCLEAKQKGLNIKIIWGFDNYEKELKNVKEVIYG
jgi:hypothetical protein